MNKHRRGCWLPVGTNRCGGWLLALAALPGMTVVPGSTAAQADAAYWRQQLQWQTGWMPAAPSAQLQQRLRWSADAALPLADQWQLQGGLRVQYDNRQTQAADSALWWGSTTPARFSLQQLALRYQDARSRLTVGRQVIDWRLTDTVSVADVWTVPDYQDLPTPAQQPQPALRWQWQPAWPDNSLFSHSALEWVYSPSAPAPWLPAGVWAPPVPAALMPWRTALQQVSARSGEARPGEARSGETRPGVAQPGEARPGAAQHGLRLSGDRAGLQWSAFGYDGVDLMPVLQLTPAGPDWFYRRQQVLGGTAQWAFGAQLLRFELAQVRQRYPQTQAGQLAQQPPIQPAMQPAMQQGVQQAMQPAMQQTKQRYWQYVAAIEREWFAGPAQWLLLLQYSDERASPALAPESWYPDFGRVFRRQWLGRLQFDPAGDLQQQWQLEWAVQPSQDAMLLKVRYLRRLSDQQELEAGWQGLQGSPASLWGQYRWADQWQLTLRWFF